MNIYSSKARLDDKLCKTRKENTKELKKFYRSISSWTISRLETIVLGINLNVETLT